MSHSHGITQIIVFPYPMPDRQNVPTMNTDGHQCFPAEPPSSRVCTTPAPNSDACGVGFVVHMKGRKLARHRAQGAAGPDQSGAPRRLRLRGEHRRRRRHPDPDARRVPARRSCPFTLPAAGAYGAGLVFLPHERTRSRDASRRSSAASPRKKGRRCSAGATCRPTTAWSGRARARRSRSSSRCSSVPAAASPAPDARGALRAQAVRHPQARRARRRHAEDQRARRAASSTSSACRRTR